jgi:hypothetical protein
MAQETSVKALQGKLPVVKTLGGFGPKPWCLLAHRSTSTTNSQRQLVFDFLGQVAGCLTKQLGSLPLQGRKDRSPEEATGFTAKGTTCRSSSKNQKPELATTGTPCTGRDLQSK